MNDSIKINLDKIRLIESQQLSEVSAAAAPAAKVAGKGIGRFMPGVGAALGAYDAYNRAKQGDWAGAGLSALGGAASLVPGVGTAASLGIAGVQALRDKQRTGSYLPGDEEIAAAAQKDQQAASQPAAQTPAKGDPKVFALQQQLIAKGAKIKADGVMGPQTQTAMKQFGMSTESKKNKGKTMSESEKMAALRNQLRQLDEANPLTTAIQKGMQYGGKAVQGAKSFAQGVAKGVANPAATKLKNVAAGTTAGTKGIKTGAAIATNPAKLATGAAALGGAAGYMAGKPGQPTPAAGKPAIGSKPAPKKAPAATANALPDPKEVEELNRLAASLENSQDPQDIALMKQYNGIINAINNRAKGEKRTQGEIAAGADLNDAGL